MTQSTGSAFQGPHAIATNERHPAEKAGVGYSLTSVHEDDNGGEGLVPLLASFGEVNVRAVLRSAQAGQSGTGA